MSRPAMGWLFLATSSWAFYKAVAVLGWATLMVALFLLLVGDEE